MNSRDDQIKGAPQGYFVVVPADNASERVDIHTLFLRLWKGRYWVIASVALFGGIAAANAMWSAPVYEAAAVLAVRSQEMEGAASALRGQFGGIASLAGINLGQSGRRREEFIAYLRSGALAREFVEQQGLVRVFFGSRWNDTTKTFTPDSRGRVPTTGLAAERFMRGVREISVDERTGLLRLSIKWTDPKTASKWANAYVDLSNQRLRDEAIASAAQSIGFLNEELAKTTVEPLRQSLYRLLEGRLNDSMLANVERQYAFKVIDRAQVPERHVRPRRVLETFIGLVCGFVAGCLLALWFHPAVNAVRKI